LSYICSIKLSLTEGIWLTWVKTRVLPEI